MGSTCGMSSLLMRPGGPIAGATWAPAAFFSLSAMVSVLLLRLAKCPAAL